MFIPVHVSLVVLAGAEAEADHPLHLALTDDARLPSVALAPAEGLTDAACRAAETVAPDHTNHLRGQVGTLGGGSGLIIAYRLLLPGLVPLLDGHRWVPVSGDGTGTGLSLDLPALSWALDALADEITRVPIVLDLLPGLFTFADVHTLYEHLWDTAVDLPNLRRKFLRAEAIVETPQARRRLTPGRPAALYRRGTAHRIDPPVMPDRH